MFIEPMKTVGSIEELKQGRAADKSLSGTGESGSVFQDIFQNAIEDVKTTEEELTKQQYLLSTGQIDDAHTVPIAAAQAQLSVDLLVQLRNKALESYNELMRMNI